jgi:predicted house-cleaning noncanonical NTP pyrophosphatase (MazG superfamily)
MKGRIPVLNIIETLEKLGQDSALRYASDADLETALRRAGVHESVRAAILAKDRRRLEVLLDADAIVCCMIARPFREEEGEDDTEQRDTDKGKGKDNKDGGAKSQQFSVRRAA